MGIFGIEQVDVKSLEIPAVWGTKLFIFVVEF